ncbi:nicotinate-nucleotide--dimethylbenzimidazole phosphoribosyltransferase [Kitasatospora terrestris]|uniref:Nicotinate-nucleotide--dimethylbenzimidazole phosphoribosyltransferase n=1 Tax=Kitasatospora terrestris TaxID=258051 RepID=A0ABP9EEH7_9ACTN
MTDGGHVPNGGPLAPEPGDPGHVPGAPLGSPWSTEHRPAYTFLDQPDQLDEEEDVLLMPGPQAAWGEPIHGAVETVNVDPTPADLPVGDTMPLRTVDDPAAATPPAGTPVAPSWPPLTPPAPAAAEPVVQPAPAPAPVVEPLTAAQPQPRRPLHAGPPIPDPSLMTGHVPVRSLADRGPSTTPGGTPAYGVPVPPAPPLTPLFSDAQQPVPADATAVAQPAPADATAQPVPADATAVAQPAPADATAQPVPADATAVAQPAPADATAQPVPGEAPAAVAAPAAAQPAPADATAVAQPAPAEIAAQPVPGEAPAAVAAPAAAQHLPFDAVAQPVPAADPALVDPTAAAVAAAAQPVPTEAAAAAPVAQPAPLDATAQLAPAVTAEQPLPGDGAAVQSAPLDAAAAAPVAQPVPANAVPATPVAQPVPADALQPAPAEAAFPGGPSPAGAPHPGAVGPDGLPLAAVQPLAVGADGQVPAPAQPFAVGPDGQPQVPAAEPVAQPAAVGPDGRPLPVGPDGLPLAAGQPFAVGLDGQVPAPAQPVQVGPETLHLAAPVAPLPGDAQPAAVGPDGQPLAPVGAETLHLAAQDAAPTADAPAAAAGADAVSAGAAPTDAVSADVAPAQPLDAAVVAPQPPLADPAQPVHAPAGESQEQPAPAQPAPAQPAPAELAGPETVAAVPADATLLLSAETALAQEPAAAVQPVAVVVAEPVEAPEEAPAQAEIPPQQSGRGGQHRRISAFLADPAPALTDLVPADLAPAEAPTSADLPQADAPTATSEEPSATVSTAEPAPIAADLPPVDASTLTPDAPAAEQTAAEQTTVEAVATELIVEAATVEGTTAEPVTAEPVTAEPVTAEDADAERPPAAPGFDDAGRDAVHQVIRERRDIRNGFRGDPIPHEVLIRVLEAAHTAPSVGYSQPWDFVVIRSSETRRKMHQLAMRQRDEYADSLPKGRAKQFKEIKIEAILETPVNIVVTADRTRGGRHTLGRHTQPQMAPYSAALAVENLWLAARAEGLGVGWVSFFDEEEMVRELGLPEHLDVVAYLCVGYVDSFPDEPELQQQGWAKKRPLSWVVHEEQYGNRALPGEEPHDLLSDTLRGIRPLDAKALGEAWDRQKRMTKPAGSLGMLEIIAAQLSGLSRKCPPPIPEPACVAIFAGDHGVHAQGVTPWPQEVTGQMVGNFLAGGAVVNAFAAQVGAEVCVVDVGVKVDLPEAIQQGRTTGLLPRKVKPGTDDMTQGPAMSRDEALRAVEVGIETARDLVAAGNKVLITGDMGIANTTASAALISVFTGADPVEVTGRGTGIDDETHARKVDVIRRALALHQPDPADPIGVVAAVGGLEHAALAGFLLGAASLRTPVILDGVIAGSAALVAKAIAPEVLASCIAGHRSAEPGHQAALAKLGLRPLIDLDLRLGEGTGALLALPLVQSAARAMHDVATFDSAGVTEKA